MQTKQDGRLGTEKIGKLMLELALPSVLAQIVNVLYNIVDRIYIGHIPGEGRKTGRAGPCGGRPGQCDGDCPSDSGEKAG